MKVIVNDKLSDESNSFKSYEDALKFLAEQMDLEIKVEE